MFFFHAMKAFIKTHENAAQQMYPATFGMSLHQLFFPFFYYSQVA